MPTATRSSRPFTPPRWRRRRSTRASSEKPSPPNRRTEIGILSDRQIRNEIKITPFKDYGPKEPGTISSGLGSYGYDVRLGYKFKLFSPIGAKEIDPKNFDPKCLVEGDLSPSDLDYDPKTGKWVEKFLLIPPHSFVLAESLEHFEIPRDVLCVVVGKSTYARCGLIVNVTPGEPEWPGVWTIEISNTTPLPVRVYPGEGIMQCLFFRSDDSENGGCERSYADKVGKYMHQTGLTLPKADGV